MHRGPLVFLNACILYLTASTVVWGGTLYIAANGSDANNGTSKSTPWVHAPGMPNCTGSCAAHTPVAGDKFIFRGGDSWHFGNSGAIPYTGGAWDMHNWNGNETNCVYEGVQTGCIYYGVDLTWFTGASWVRPILNADNVPSTSLVASCAHQIAGGVSSNQLTILGTASILDNFEMLGLCASQSGEGGPASTYMAYYGNGNGCQTGTHLLLA